MKTNKIKINSIEIDSFNFDYESTTETIKTLMAINYPKMNKQTIETLIELISWANLATNDIDDLKFTSILLDKAKKKIANHFHNKDLVETLERGRACNG